MSCLGLRRSSKLFRVCQNSPGDFRCQSISIGALRVALNVCSGHKRSSLADTDSCKIGCRENVRVLGRSPWKRKATRSLPPPSSHSLPYCSSYALCLGGRSRSTVRQCPCGRVGLHAALARYSRGLGSQHRGPDGRNAKKRASARRIDRGTKEVRSPVAITLHNRREAHEQHTRACCPPMCRQDHTGGLSPKA
jgi:hypothetical protein